jgi:hypothetical protein
MDANELRDAALSGALADLAFVEVEIPEGFGVRVLAVLDGGADDRGRAARLAVIRARERAWGVGRRGFYGAAGWARRSRVLRSGALASSAIVVGAVAIGLEARHVRRSRHVRAA